MNIRSGQLHSHATRTAARYTYEALAADFFYIHYRDCAVGFPSHRDDRGADSKKPYPDRSPASGDTVQKPRYRMVMPETIARTQPPGMEWVIERRSRSEFAFRLLPIGRIVPNPQLADLKIPDATPEIVAAYALSDEQALLARVRYNRLLDIFLGVAAYSLQSHLRTTVKDLGQVEIDGIYVAVDKRGRQYVLPVQAKGGNDRLSTAQTRQDLACCAEKFPQLVCRPISAQFMEDDLIALFELGLVEGEVQIVDERHYKLVSADRISADDLRAYDR